MKKNWTATALLCAGIFLALTAPTGTAQAVEPIGAGPVMIQAQVGTNKIADIRKGSKSPNAIVQIYTAANPVGPRQQFTVDDCDASGACQVKNLASNLCLEVKGGKDANGTGVVQNPCVGGPAQLWKPVKQSDGTYGIQSMVGEDRWLKVSYGKTANQTPLVIAKWAQSSKAMRFAFAVAPNWGLTYSQVAQKTTVTGKFADVATLSGTWATKVTVTATMKYKSTTTRTVKLTQDLPASGEFTFDLGEYGPWKISTVFYKGSTKVRTNSTVSLGVVADEYILAPVTMTMPVTMLTTSMWGANSIRGADNTIPVIAQLNRTKHWNWNKLPSGVHALPYLTKAQYTKVTSGVNMNANIAPFQTYIKDLYALNKNSVFTLFVNDNDIWLIQKLLYANKIPEANYKIRVVSDGTFSYTSFTKWYTKGDAAAAHPTTTHAAYLKKWQDYKTYAYKYGKTNSKLTRNNAHELIWAAIDNDPKAQYWLTRPSLLTLPGQPGDPGPSFAAAVIANPKVVTLNINGNLNAIKAAGTQALTEFKDLFQFNDAYFAKSEASGKDVMMFLGTRLDVETNFADYAAFTKKYYGSAYDYYYKGHPASPTASSSAKVKQLSSLAITDVDSSVPAELILFFNPGIYMSGYQSSTYTSVSDPNMAKGLFATTKAAGLSISSPDYSIMGWFMAPKSAYSGALAALPGDYIVEFADKVVAQKGYNVATWTTKTSKIAYYKLVNGAYTAAG